jgi:hypothetical protein
LIYRANFSQMADLLSYLTLHCCQGEDCCLTDETSASGALPC